MIPNVLYRIFHRVWMLLPTRYRLSTYRWLVGIGLRFYGPTESPRTIFRLPFNLIAKYGDGVTETEANIMRFVAKRTTIPVPSVVDYIQIPSGAFIVMTRLPGRRLRAELNFMTDDERARFSRDLGSALKQLHALTAPGSRISAFDGGPVTDLRINHGDSEGPFESEKDFYEHMYSRIPQEYHARLRDVAREVHDTPHRLRFTHNDLDSFNVLIHKNSFSGLIGWKHAAWLPEWWEYASSIYIPSLYVAWLEAMDTAHPKTYPRELEVQRQFWDIHMERTCLCPPPPRAVFKFSAMHEAYE